MTAKYFAILTNQGAARLANAAALGTKLNLTQMAVGDANGVLPTPDPAQTKLINQKRIAPLNLLTVDPANTSQIIAEQIIPENEGGFWIREIGLYDDDGILIAVANCPETYKPELQEGSGRTQTIRMILIVSSTSAITLKIDPSVVLATRQYVDSQLRAHEQSRNHPDASTTEKGFVQLSSSVTSDSESQAATSKAVKIAMDNANARLAKERNLADLPNPALARQNLQLGNSSTKNIGTTADTVAAGDDARITGAMQKNQNGGDIPDVAKFLQNLGSGDGTLNGRLLNIRVLTSSGNYTPTLGTKKIKVTVIGGGGGSGGVPATTSFQYAASGGGAAGSSVVSLIDVSTLTFPLSYTIGAGGAPGAGAPVTTNGGPGGTTTFGPLTAPGGNGSVYGALVNQGNTGISGNATPGAIGTGGNILNMRGSAGGYAFLFSANTISGYGGDSLLGKGGFGVGFPPVRSLGTGYGSGGSGVAINLSSAAIDGTAGTAGVIIVEEYA
ncbi:TPA: phage tail protein [Enterobacter kobei]